MSARGARSRKVQQKDIEKKEKKTVVKAKGKATGAISEEAHDPFISWRPGTSLTTRPTLSRSITVSSSTSRGTSRSGDSVNRQRLTTLNSKDSSYGPPQSSGGASTSISDVSSKGKEKAKFQANGKDTRAPRGRGGGVPVKKTVATSPVPPVFQHERNESPASYIRSNQKSWMNFRVWDGRKERPYGGFDYDEDMRNGSVFIYFKEEQVDEDHPIPSICAELEVLEHAGSTWLNNTLLYSRVDENDLDDWAVPNSTDSLAPHQLSPNYPQPSQRRMLGPTSPGGRSPPPFDIDRSSGGMDSRAPSRLQHFSQLTQLDGSNSPPPFRPTGPGGPTHKIWFTAPANMKTPQDQRLHHVAIRNSFAMLHGKSIVGADLFEMLSTLQVQLQVMYDLDGDDQTGMTPRERSIQMITGYLSQHGIDDVRNSTQQALALLAWAEQDTVKWRQGYLECFVHLAGVMTPQVEDFLEFKRLSVVTRRNLTLAAKTLQLRVIEAEEKLAMFDFIDLWEDATKASTSQVYQSYQQFRLFLINHYTAIYGNWPPNSKTWLNRKMVLSLQEDFGSLYDYLVNRDVSWNPREERATRKWEMAHRKDPEFAADLPELGITDMLIRFDARYGYAHIPHPYPLLPRQVAKPTKQEKEKKGFFDRMKKEKPVDHTAKDAKAHLQLSIVFSDATNIEKLDVNFNGSNLIDKFEEFELTTSLRSMTPREARLGRWVLLYSILQVLSSLSVDVRGLKYTENVRYFLCTDLKRCPEWVTNGQIDLLEATQERSWCWQRSWSSAPIQAAPIELEARSASRSPMYMHNSTIRAAQSNEDVIYGLPSPPPERSLPEPPRPSDGSTILQNDIRRLGEKIDNYSLTPNASQFFRQEMERRRENEKVMQREFGDRKPPLEGETYGPRVTRASPPMGPNPNLGHNGPNPNFGNNMNPNLGYRPREDSLPLNFSGKRINSTQHQAQLQAHIHPSMRSPLRSHHDRSNPDLESYGLSRSDTNNSQWSAVPPRYTERERDSPPVRMQQQQQQHMDPRMNVRRDPSNTRNNAEGRDWRESTVLGDAPWNGGDLRWEEYERGSRSNGGSRGMRVEDGRGGWV